MIKFLIKAMAFIGLLAVMGVISQIPYGLYVNTFIVGMALWKLVNE